MFRTLFWPLYPPEARADLARARATDANPAQNPALFAQVDRVAEVFARLFPAACGEDPGLDFSDASIHRLAPLLTVERRASWLAETGPDGAPLLAHLVLHGVAYVGACVVRNHGGQWRLRAPLWESLVHLVSRAGEGELAIFSWWLRALSDGEIGRGTLLDRYRINVEVPCARPEELPVIAAPDRRLPRLKRPRYDTLHKYLRAHLPELRDLGGDFPSPERFTEMAFEWLDFVLVGEGRMVLMHGPTDRGTHFFWLDAGGFSKALYFPADAFPEHQVRLEGDKVQILVPLLGQTVMHEVLWWGP
ncbi:MAG: hypothetical protein EOO75_07670 [Myxococcales bacterium]|nr:MAG: hypothetical protein EOO75_07670 [Myxococcales bacterium]